MTHPELDGLEIKVLRQWEHAKPLTAEQLVKLDQEKQGIEQQKVEEKVFEIMNARIAAMEVHLQENPNSKKRKDLTRVKGRFFEARSQDLELRALADVLGLVGEMEMQIFGLDENDKKLVFNQELVRDLICLLYTSPSPRDATLSRMPSSA